MLKDRMNRRSFLKSAFTATVLGPAALSIQRQAMAANVSRHPNIVLIYADDVGYGDLNCYGADTVPTPNVNRLAREGLRFTNAYASSATCTPSRYSLLTGQYAWRKKGTGVLPGNAALIIDTNCRTLPAMLKQAGYATGVVGKWHLGLGNDPASLDWNADIKPGPLEIGFDYAYLMPATGDRVPCVFVENHRVANLDPNDPIAVSYQKPFPDQPTGQSHRDQLKMDWSHGHNQSIVNSIGRIGYMSGGSAAVWKDEDMADRFVEKAVGFIEDKKEKPFFLYFATHDIHVPRVPHPRFVGKTSMGPRGDAIVQFDWCVGQILDTLDRLGLTDNTLVVLTSDNGPVVDDGYKDGAVELLGEHKPGGPLRGGKYSAFDAGTREPFMVRWPKQIKPGVSGALVSQVDFIACFAALTGQTLKADDAPDSLNQLDALMGEDSVGRSHVIQQGSGTMAVVKGKWKYIVPSNGPKKYVQTNTETGCDAEPQLYDLKQDPGEKNNLAKAHPDIVKELETLLQEIKQAGRTRS